MIQESITTELRNILEANGITEETAKNNPTKIEKLEMIHWNCPKIIPSLSRFTNLRELCIVAQDINSISGLEEAKSLEILWICETKLSKIEGLTNLKQLKRLFLYSNQISLIENLEPLSQLEVLWLCNNNIQSLDGIEALHNLTTLWIAGNKISKIGTTLSKLSKLTELNLSDNKICNFRTLWDISKCLKLKILSLEDPLYGRNPLCKLENYRMFAISTIKSLRELDGIEIKDKDRSESDLMLSKRKNWFRMQMHLIKREIAKDISTISTFINQISEQSFVELRKVKLLLKESQRELFLLTQSTEGFATPVLFEGNTSLTKTDFQNLHEKIAKIGELIRENELTAARFQSIVETFRDELSSYSKRACERLALEHENCGNLSFREGSDDDQWALTCAELISTRISLQSKGIQSVKIRQILRVSNSILSSMFQETTKRNNGNVEFLFFCPLNANEVDIQSISENGFQTDNYLSFTNSVDISIEAFLHLPNDKNLWNCKLVVCRVSDANKIEEDKPISDPISFTDDCEAIIRKGLKPKQRIWIVKNPQRNVIPEFIVDLDCIGTRNETFSPLFELVDSIPQTFYGKENSTLLFAAKSLCNKLSEEINPNRISEAFQKLQKLPPIIPPRIPPLEITENSIKNLARVSDNTAVLGMNFVGCRISSLENISKFTSIKLLVLAFNSIRDISALSAIHSLEILDISHNLIKKCSSISNLVFLKELLLEHNLISDFEEIRPIGMKITSITKLSINGNPLTLNPWFHKSLLETFPKLVFLNEKPITSSEKSILSSEESDIYPINAHYLKRDSFCVSKNDIVSPKRSDSTSEWESKVMELDLSCRGLRSLSGTLQFENFKKLMSLSLRYNNLHQLDGIQCCSVSLTELFVENNRIKDLQSISLLTNLKHLEIGSNKISSLKYISSLINLEILAVNDNSISNLDGVQFLKQLKELYVANNQISNLKSISFLQSLPNLCFLDLTGNPLCLVSEYRISVVNKLRLVKVLDGIVVDKEELANSISRFEGLFGEELLEEKANLKPLSEVTKLDFSGLKIRTIGISQSILMQLSSLKELVLSNNNLTTIDPILCLPSLEVLKVSSNKIEIISNGQIVPTIRELDLSMNKIKDIGGIKLERFPGLRILSLASNSIFKIDGIDAALPNLEELILDKNTIKTFSGITKLTKLQVLRICGNRFSDVIEFDKLKPLVSLREIFVSGNTVSHKSHFLATLFSVLPALIILDGKQITSEDRIRNLQEIQLPFQEEEERGPFTAPCSPKQRVAVKSRVIEFPLGDTLMPLLPQQRKRAKSGSAANSKKVTSTANKKDTHDDSSSLGFITIRSAKKQPPADTKQKE